MAVLAVGTWPLATDVDRVRQQAAGGAGFALTEFVEPRESGLEISFVESAGCLGQLAGTSFYGRIRDKFGHLAV